MRGSEGGPHGRLDEIFGADESLTRCLFDETPLEQTSISTTGTTARCPKCGRVFHRMFSVARSLEHAQRIAASSTEALGQVREEYGRLAPEMRSELVHLGERLAAAETTLAALPEQIAQARATLASLLPNEVDLAYVKTARAETERLTRLVNDLTRDRSERQGLAAALGQNWLAAIAIGLALAAIVLTRI